MSIQVPLPILITKENKWFVASCPILDIATQGKTEKEVKENMTALINDYFSDPDTQKPSMEDLMFLSLTNIPVKIPEGVIHSKASTTATAKGNWDITFKRFWGSTIRQAYYFQEERGERVLTTWVPHHREVTVFVIQYIIKQTEKERSEFE